MCVIIIKNNNLRLLNSVILKSVSYNPDGYGMTYLDTWETVKTMDMKEAVKLLSTERPFIAHCRKSTVGHTELENVHPFHIKDDMFLFHNGTVSIPTKKKESDTKALASFISRYNPMSKDMRIVLEMTDSRFVITDHKKKKYSIFNRSYWTQADGIQFSKSNVLRGNLLFVYDNMKSGHLFDSRLKWEDKMGDAMTTNPNYVFEYYNDAKMVSLEDGSNATHYPPRNVFGELYCVGDSFVKSHIDTQTHTGAKLVDISVECNGLTVTAKTMVYPKNYILQNRKPISSLFLNDTNKAVNNHKPNITNVQTVTNLVG